MSYLILTADTLCKICYFLVLVLYKADIFKINRISDKLYKCWLSIQALIILIFYSIGQEGVLGVSKTKNFEHL